MILISFAWATLNYLTLLAGFRLRKKEPQRHALLMKIAMSSDILLVLVIELRKNAIAEVIGLKLSPLNLAHVLFSTLAVLLYFPLFISGQRLLKSPIKTHAHFKFHKVIGFAALIFRSLGFILMFSLLTKV